MTKTDKKRISQRLAKRLGLKFDEWDEPYRPIPCAKDNGEPGEVPLWIDGPVWNALVSRELTLEKIRIDRRKGVRR
jgi:hypothetical protein